MIVVDTSVIIAAMQHSEVHHEVAKDWFDKNEGEELLVPRFCLLEIASVLSRRKVSLAAIEKILSFVQKRFSISELDDLFVRENTKIVSKCFLRTGDAIFVTTAYLEEARYLVTLDKEQAERSKDLIKSHYIKE